MAVKAVACELPRTFELPLSRLFVPDIQKEVIRQGIVASISGSTVWRWLDHDAIRPWTFRSWIFPRDPHFEAKAGVVLDLYARQFEGKALGDNDFVVSADEKTSIQARCRCHPSVPAAPGSPVGPVGFKLELSQDGSPKPQIFRVPSEVSKREPASRRPWTSPA